MRAVLDVRAIVLALVLAGLLVLAALTARDGYRCRTHRDCAAGGPSVRVHG
jgi:hypothetical protein